MIVSVKPLPKSKKKAPKNNTKPKQLGVQGEKRAAFFLTSLAYIILDRNFRVGGGELDLIAWDPQTSEVVFVEVKTRHQIYSGDPSFAVDPRKLRALLRAGRAYMYEVWKKDNGYRIDIVAVTPGKIKHFKNISWELLK